MNFNGSHGCTKCEVIGKYSHVSGTVVFTKMNANRRTDESFRNKTDPAHHRGETPLTDLPIDMVLDFPVGDELHLLHLGLMRKFLLGWKSGSFGMRTKWSARNELQISAYLSSCNEFKPFEIHRKIRPLSDIMRWKGTEFRTFLLYCSLTVLRNFLPVKYFEHFLLFYCSVVILGSEYHCIDMINIAGNMIESFLDLFKTIYGVEHFSSNLHNLIHLVDEVRRFGVLGKFNAYSFENKLQKIKKLFRSGNLPLIQIARRLMEKDKKGNEKPIELSKTVQCCKIAKYNCEAFKKDGTDYTVYEELKTNGFRIGKSKNNKWVLTRHCEIVCIHYIVLYSNKRCFIYGQAIAEKKPYFEIPFDSSALFIYGAKYNLQPKKIYPIEEVACKMFCLPYFGSFNDSEEDEEFPPFHYVFVPLWHTLKNR